MRGPIAIILAFCLANVLAPLPARADSNAGKSLDDLRADIRKLEAVERDPATPAEVAALNRELLAGKRERLHAALSRRKAAFENYLRTVGASLNQREVQKVEASIGNLQSEMGRLEELIAGTTIANSEASDVPTLRSAPGGAQSASRTPNAHPLMPAQYLSTASEGGRTPSGIQIPFSNIKPARLTPILSTAPEVQAQAGGGPSCPSCLPSIAPEEKKDFIINARTGETSGRKKFGLRETARIIVKEKNPFLYEYRVTLKDKPIIESAIGDFFGNFPLFADALKPKDEAAAANVRNSTRSCPELAQQFPTESSTLSALLQLLEDADSSAQGTNSLRIRYTTQKNAYDEAAQQLDDAKKVLYDQNASCENLCKTATGIRSTLQQYKPDLQQLSDDINLFKSRADNFQRGVQDLETKARQVTPPLPAACFTLLDHLRTLASGYMSTANTFEAGILKITNGKKTFDTAIKTINNVFSSPNAFYQVYTRGEYGLPTDVEITVERKDVTKNDAAFVKLVEGQTINFGGGPRFALAGGIAGSPFETVNYKRVSALVGGRSTFIVGEDEGSNSRILPMLMLHGRLFETPGGGIINGIHMSLGITAKPNDEGTNVEFLVGPSLSFIEERLFLTFGGYAGRRQQLQGNLAPGAELPEEFGAEIPVSKRLVWKPGFALTYKFK